MYSFSAGRGRGRGQVTGPTNQEKWAEWLQAPSGGVRRVVQTVDTPAASRADQTGTGLKGRISQNLQDLIRLKASLCVKRRFSSLSRRGPTLTSLREVCEIRDLLSVGGGRPAKRRVGDESIRGYATLPRCVFLWLCSARSCCVFKLSAAYAKSQQGEEKGVLLGKKKPQQILEIFERFISNTPRLFNSFYPVGARLILLASWRGCKIYFSFRWLFCFDCLVVAASLEVSEILAKWKNLSVSLCPIYALLA